VPLGSTRGLGIVLKRINQDIVEHHFGHTRAGAGSTDAPTEFQCDKADEISQVLRYVKGVMIRGNVSEGEVDFYMDIRPRVKVKSEEEVDFSMEMDIDMDEADQKRKDKPIRDSPYAKQASKKSKEDKGISTSCSEKDLPRQQLFM
jgi:hypothetical protein